MNTPARAEEPLDFRGNLQVLRRRKWGIIIVTIVTVVFALAFSFRQTPIYRSTATVLVKPPTTQLLQNVPAANLISMDTEQAVVTSVKVADIAAGTLHDAPEAEVLLRNLSVSVPADSQILQIAYSDPSPLVAQGRAQAFADAYLEFKTQQTLDARVAVNKGIQSQIDGLLEELGKARAAFDKAAPGSPEQQAAQNDMDIDTGQIAILRNQMGTVSAFDLSPGTILQPASLPTSPASPNHLLNGAFGLFFGLALGVGLAFLRERLDDRLKGREDLDETIGAPTLAVVPAVLGWKKRDHSELVSITKPTSPPAEAYRTIRTNLQFIARGGNMKVLSVTSPSGGEGKTTTSANLAVVLAQAGKRVIAVSADLRKPRLHRFFGLENKVGVSSVLSGQASISEAVQRVKDLSTLLVLASGPIPPNPAELLGSEEMREFLQELRSAADFVVVDTAPVLAVSDALALAPLSDGVLIVADASSTTRGALAHAREQLEQVSANVIGGILNNLDQSSAKYYPSYYRSYYSYRDQRKPEVTEIETNGKRGAALDPEELWR